MKSNASLLDLGGAVNSAALFPTAHGSSIPSDLLGFTAPCAPFATDWSVESMANWLKNPQSVSVLPDFSPVLTHEKARINCFNKPHGECWTAAACAAVVEIALVGRDGHRIAFPSDLFDFLASSGSQVLPGNILLRTTFGVFVIFLYNYAIREDEQPKEANRRRHGLHYAATRGAAKAVIKALKKLDFKIVRQRFDLSREICDRYLNMTRGFSNDSVSSLNGLHNSGGVCIVPRCDFDFRILVVPKSYCANGTISPGEDIVKLTDTMYHPHNLQALAPLNYANPRWNDASFAVAAIMRNIAKTVAAGKGHFCDREGGRPPLAPHLTGWDFLDHEGHEYAPNGPCLGWIDADEEIIYLDPALCFQMIIRGMARSGQKFPITRKKFGDFLKAEEILSCFDPGRATARRTLAVKGIRRERRVFCIQIHDFFELADLSVSESAS